MGDTDTREPFRCPARECRNGQLGTDFGDTKHFYRHWCDTHRPKCPRTDCRFNKQRLSKSTESYFMRHWGSHYPALIIKKSACGKCGQEFPNASNRDRHARKCTGSSATAFVPTQQDANHPYARGPIAISDTNTAFGDVPNDNCFPYSGDTNASGLVQDSTQTALFAMPQRSSHRPAEILGISTDVLLMTNDHISAREPSSIKPQQQMISASPEWLLGFDTAQASERRKSIEARHTQHAAESTFGDWHLNTSVPTRAGECRVTNNMDLMSGVGSQSQARASQTDNSGSLWPLLDPFHLSTPEVRGSTVDQVTLGVYCSVVNDLPMRIRRQYAWVPESTQWVEKKTSSRHVIKHKRVVAVKSYVPSLTGYREVSSDQQIWIHKIVRKLGRNGRKIIETTTFIVNNTLNSKTKHPRIIDDDAPVWQLCATGQYDEVNRLLSQHIVTIFDVDSAGRTLLHVAASYWQLNLCRLLLAKGAHIEAREWQYECTPFSLACRESHRPRLIRRQSIDYSSNDLADVLALMVQNGTDICAEIELQECQIYLALVLQESDATAPWSMKRKLSLAFSWLSRTHRLTTTCDGIVPNVALPQRIYSALSYSDIFNDDMHDFWSLERFNCRIFMSKDTQAIQSFWLLMIWRGELCGSYRRATLSSDYFMMYRTDFHYQGLLQNALGTVETTTPLQTALRSFDAFATFHYILLASGTDPHAFVAKESTMPWCNYTQQTLENLFSVNVDAYEKLRPLFRHFEICRNSDCSPGPPRAFWFNGLLDWDEVIALVRSGRSLVSLLKFPSQEEERRSHLASNYCHNCRSEMAGSSESYVQRWGGRDDEDTGFIEGELLENFDSDGQPSVGDDQMMVDGQDSYDESLSSEDSSDEELWQFVRGGP